MTDLIEYLPFLRNGLPFPTTMCRGSEMGSQTLQEEEVEEVHEEEEDEEEEEWEVPAAAPEEGSEILGDRSQAPDRLAWSLRSLEQALYLSLPTWIQTALLCNLMTQIGLTGFPNWFPVRVMSYLLLPYTLTICFFFTFSYRLVLRVKHIPDDAHRLWQDTKQGVCFLISVAVSRLKKNLVDRFLPSLSVSPVSECVSEEEVPMGTSRLRRRSTLRLQLSTAGSAPDANASAGSEPLAFAFQLDLELEVDSQPHALPLRQQPLPLELHPDSEGEVEASATPHVSFPLCEEEEEEEDGSRGGMDQDQRPR